MDKKWKMGLAFSLAAAAAVAALTVQDARAGRGDGPVIYVKGQGLFYDSIVTADSLPPNGPFQKLEMGGPSPDGLQTEFGPGDTGYHGGRWWVDVNGDNVMDDGDRYFSCPLLPPGREEP